jgi:phospholipase/carboxylesterase
VEVVTGGAQASDPLPMVVAIHGLGDKPSAFVDLFRALPAKVRVVAPAGPSPHGPGFSWFDVRGASNPDSLAPGIAKAADALAAWIAQLAAQRPTVGKPVVTGFSQGGMLSFALAIRHPQLIAAAIPVAGALPKALWPESAVASQLPAITALHGAADTRVPYDGAKLLVAHLETLGWAAKLQSFEGVAHRIPEPVRAALYAAIEAHTAGLAK